ncbi:unnamed protein product [Caenorhabditis auriculariae]|uniref:Uncharacterized protein n=1 Tax=Caenorhabditis auriculariae TaxID=2777116 RepID=A0A8S1H1W2_9PELO|nr:unnamed protein product [Caenorhabditis auriculariae]
MAQRVMVQKNKLAEQEKSFMSQTFTLDTNKNQRLTEFRSIEDAIRGFVPRARSSGPRRSFRGDENVRRVRSETSTLFSSTCKLPSLDNKTSSGEKKTCTMRPWSRTQEELRKFKETLKTT